MLGLLAKIISKTESAVPAVCNWKHFSNCLSSLSVLVTLPPLASTKYRSLQKRMKTYCRAFLYRKHPQTPWAGQHRAHQPHDERTLISSPLKDRLSEPTTHHVCTLGLGTRGASRHPVSPRESLSKLFTEFLCLREREWAHRNQQAWNQH